MKGLIIALQFMTRIPLPIKMEVTEEDFGSCNKYFPLVGLIIGLFLGLFYYFFHPFLSKFVLAALLVIGEIVITGGLHLDGFMDTMDGILSARSRERTLEIMKDSRVGAHSVTALFCLLLLKFTILATFPEKYIIGILVLMPMISRWMMLFTLAFYPYARPEGLGKIFWLRTHRSSWYINTIILFIIFLIIFPPKFFLALLSTFIIIFFLINKISNNLGGHTGDTYGAVSELTEIVFISIALLIV